MNIFSKADGRAEGVDVRDFGAVGDGRVDDTRAIQNALDRGGSKIVIPHGLYSLSSPLRPQSHQEVRIIGTLRVAPAIIRELSADVAPGDTSVRVAEAGAFRPGQWVTVADDDLPRQRGGLQVRRQGAECAPVTAVEADRLHFAHAFRNAYRKSSGARAGTQSSAILIENQSHVTLCGSGIIDGNKEAQFDVAPSRIDGPGEEVRAGCCIAGFAVPGRLRQVVIHGLTLRHAILHNLSLFGASHCRVLDASCHASHDKNLILLRAADCLLRGNTCTDSEFEDGIIFHQNTGCRRIMVQGNLCSGNARNGLHVGANERSIHLSGNLCVRNGTNLFIAGKLGSSTGDVSLGENFRLFPPEHGRSGVVLAGDGNRISNLTARGATGTNVRIRAARLGLIGGSIGGCDDTRSDTGIMLCEPGPYTSAVLPEQILIQGVLISQCRTGLHLACVPRNVRVLQNTFDDNERARAADSDAARAAVRCADNDGLE